MALIPETMAAARMTRYDWDYGCIITSVIMATGVGTQDPNSLPDNKILPLQNSHVEIVTPAMLYQQETIQMQECATMASTGIFLDPVPGTQISRTRVRKLNISYSQGVRFYTH